MDTSLMVDIFYSLTSLRAGIDGFNARQEVINRCIRAGIIDKVVSKLIDDIPEYQRSNTTSLITAILRLTHTQFADAVDEAGEITRQWNEMKPVPAT